MDPEVKKRVLRMIPYGLYVLTAAKGEEIAAGTVNWVTQASFDPPLVAVGVKVGSRLHDAIEEGNGFALNVLGKDHQSLAFTFFKPAERVGQTISGEPFRFGKNGAPVLANAAGFVECDVVAAVAEGDHTLYIGRVLDAGLNQPVSGREDEATLWLRDLGEKIFYGG